MAAFWLRIRFTLFSSLFFVSIHLTLRSVIRIAIKCIISCDCIAINEAVHSLALSGTLWQSLRTHSEHSMNSLFVIFGVKKEFNY